MAPTVALLGASGLLGSHILQGLAQQQQAGKLSIVLLHRPNSDLSKAPAGVDKRVLDTSNASAEEVAQALQGVDVLISASKDTEAGGQNFIKNLATVKSLKVYIPSWFTANWTDEEGSNPANVYLNMKWRLLQKTKELGIPVSTVSNGLFEGSFLTQQFGGVDVKGNKLFPYHNALNNQFSFVSLPYLGQAVAQLILSPDFGPNKNWTIVEAQFTGEDVARALEQAHGAPPKMDNFNDHDVEAARKKGPVDGLGAAWRMHWGNGQWRAVNEFVPQGVEKRTIVQAVKDAAKQ